MWKTRKQKPTNILYIKGRCPRLTLKAGSCPSFIRWSSRINSIAFSQNIVSWKKTNNKLTKKILIRKIKSGNTLLQRDGVSRVKNVEIRVIMITWQAKVYTEATVGHESPIDATANTTLRSFSSELERIQWRTCGKTARGSLGWRSGELLITLVC